MKMEFDERGDVIIVFTNSSITDKLRNVQVGDTVFLYFGDGTNKGGVVTEATRGRLSGGMILRFANGDVINTGAMSRSPINVTINA